MLETRLGRHYGAIAFFNTILHNVFLLYHVETFVSVYRIDKASFWIGETLFLLWNSLNDPLFGWMSDKQYLTNTAVNTVKPCSYITKFCPKNVGSLFSLALCQW